MKDLTELFWFREIFAAAQRIVSYFQGADKQLAILRKNQRRLYSREYALSLLVITRWGSQYRLIMSPLKSRQALKEWAIYDKLEIPADEEKTKLQKAVIASLLDHDFWQDLEELEIIIGYIHEQQLMSESGKSHIGHIASRWKGIKDYLQSLLSRPGFRASQHLHQIFAPRVHRSGKPRLSVWDERLKKQVMDIHWAAYYLDPSTHNEEMTTIE